MSSGKYERELKGILTGDVETLEKVTKTTSEEVTRIYYLTTEKPFSVTRGAGSIGIDITAMRGPTYLPIEVKSGSGSTKYFDKKRVREQADSFAKEMEETHIPTVYMYRRKGIRGEKWTSYRMKAQYSYMYQHHPFDKMPVIDRTTHDNRKLEWDTGMPLSKLLSLILED